MIKAIPTLSSAGWVRGLSQKADVAMAYALLTDALQSNIYRGQLTSIQAIVQNNLGNLTDLQIELTQSLGGYLQRVFDDAHVEIELKDYPNEHGTRVMVVIRARIIEDGQTHDLAQQLSFVDGKFEQVNAINSFGSEQ